MKKINWKIIIITCIVCLLPIIVGIRFYNKLPSQLAIHFNIDNQADRYASKGFALFGMPIILVLLQIFCCIISDINDNKKGDKPKLVAIVKWIIPILSILVYFVMVQTALDNSIDVRRTVLIALGIIFILLGNYTPKMSFENAKLMTYPAPKNEAVYRKMSKMIGYTFVIFGILLLISLFFKPIVSAIVIILLVVIILLQGIYCDLKQ